MGSFAPQHHIPAAILRLLHQIEVDCPSLGRSYVGITQLDPHVRASTDRWQSEPDLAEYADQVLKTWERRVKGYGQVTPILQAAHVAAYLLDPMFAQVRKTCIGLPVVPDEHEHMVRDLIRRVGGRAAAVEFEQLRLKKHANHLKEPAQACADTGVSVASVGRSAFAHVQYRLLDAKASSGGMVSANTPTWPKWHCKC